MATILILDDDLGFSFWLGQTLSTAQCSAVPAATVSAAAELIGQFRLIIDLVIMNPRVPGAMDFTRNLRREQGHLRVATLDSQIFEPGWVGNAS